MLPMKVATKTKIAAASLISAATRRFRTSLGMLNHGHFQRDGILWNLDLTEGIDFAIFLMGAFEPSTIRSYRSLVESGDVVLDIGANIGAHTLPLASLVGDRGKVIAFEPTDYAFKKLQDNLALNPQLSGRVNPVQALLVGDPERIKPESIPSRWSLEREEGSKRHAVHRGVYETLDAAAVFKLDDWYPKHGSQRLDFIKIDVDGHEFEVLGGSLETLAVYKPRLMMELAPYLFAERGQGFAELLCMIQGLGYRCRIVNGPEVALDDWILSRIPELGGINVILEAV